MRVQASHLVSFCLRMLSAVLVRTGLLGPVLRLARDPRTHAALLILGYLALIVGPWAILAVLYLLLRGCYGAY